MLLTNARRLRITTSYKCDYTGTRNIRAIVTPSRWRSPLHDLRSVKLAVLGRSISHFWSLIIVKIWVEILVGPEELSLVPRGV